MAVERIELESGKRIDTRMCICEAQFRLRFLQWKAFPRALNCVCAHVVCLLPGRRERRTETGDGRIHWNIHEELKEGMNLPCYDFASHGPLNQIRNFPICNLRYRDYF